jgi:hypothetical protein
MDNIRMDLGKVGDGVMWTGLVRQRIGLGYWRLVRGKKRFNTSLKILSEKPKEDF